MAGEGLIDRMAQFNLCNLLRSHTRPTHQSALGPTHTKLPGAITMQGPVFQVTMLVLGDKMFGIQVVTPPNDLL
jgi:hypothetical protein